MRLIDADALVANHIPEECDGSEYAEGWNDAIAKIRNAPTFTGKFEDTGYSNSIGDIFQCSRCKGLINPTQEQIDRHGFPKHCHNCGAYADVEE